MIPKGVEAATGLNLPDEKIVGRKIRVSGKVALYRGASQIVVAETDQFKLLPWQKSE